jgi:hypothetical protein
VPSNQNCRDAINQPPPADLSITCGPRDYLLFPAKQLLMVEAEVFRLAIQEAAK